MRTSHTPRDDRHRRLAARRHADEVASRRSAMHQHDDHLEHLRQMQREDQSDFDAADLLPPPVAAAASEPDSELQGILDELRVVRSNPVLSAVLPGEQSHRPDDQLDDDEEMDEFHMEATRARYLDLQSSARHAASQSARPTPTAVPQSMFATPGGPHDLASQVAMMRQQHQEMLNKIELLTREGNEPRAEIQRLRANKTEDNENDRQQCRREGTGRTHRDAHHGRRPLVKREEELALSFPSLSPSSPLSLVVAPEARPPPSRVVDPTLVSIHARADVKKREYNDEDEGKYNGYVPPQANYTVPIRGTPVSDLPEAGDVEELDLSADERQIRARNVALTLSSRYQKTGMNHTWTTIRSGQNDVNVCSRSRSSLTGRSTDRDTHS